LQTHDQKIQRNIINDVIIIGVKDLVYLKDLNTVNINLKCSLTNGKIFKNQIFTNVYYEFKNRKCLDVTWFKLSGKFWLLKHWCFTYLNLGSMCIFHKSLFINYLFQQRNNPVYFWICKRCLCSGRFVKAIIKIRTRVDKDTIAFI